MRAHHRCYETAEEEQVEGCLHVLLRSLYPAVLHPQCLGPLAMVDRFVVVVL